MPIQVHDHLLQPLVCHALLRSGVLMASPCALMP